jgi:uncharacterized membrane protein YoaK (UPF0700 family)
MFRHEGPARGTRTNAQLAGYLAFVAGFVNSGGFVMIGSYTSHVTGSVGRLGNDIAMGELGAAFSALTLVFSFFVGAFAASLIIEGHTPVNTAHAYAAALLVQGLLLFVFIVLAGVSQASHPRVRDAEATLLCFSLGMQNSLVTRLSGAVVRTTHLTGVVTDLAIEAARWYRWHRSKLKVLPAFLRGRMAPERPVMAQSVLLAVIVFAFTAGGVIGAVLTLRASRWAMIIPAVAVLGASAFAYVQGNRPPSLRPPRP